MDLGARVLLPTAESRGEIEGLVATLSRELDEIAAALADTIHEHLLELEDDLRSWTVQAARSNLGAIVTMMREGDDPGAAQPPPEAISYAKEYVARGLELSLMQRAYRTGQGAFAGIVLERLRTATDDADLLAEAMSFINAWIFAWVEAIERRLTDVYLSEHAQLARGADAVRAAEVRALLGGGAVDAAAVSLRLGYELERFHVGFVIWSENAGERPGGAGELVAEMERAAETVAESLRAGVPLTVAEGGHLTCWTGSRREPDLSRLRSVGSTGSPLAPEGFDWIYEHLGSDTWLFSTSGGTDLCTAFVGGVPTLPVYRGELQARSLGASVEAWDPEGRPLIGEVGELVITEPMPSMPLYLWGDEDGSRYRESYFEMFPGTWRHGDWIEITERGTAIIHGRSDSTINRGGIRIGTAEIYRAVLGSDDIVDALVVDLPKQGTDGVIWLFVVLREGAELTDELTKSLARRVR
ncbi:MAG: AMP-binding protein, partial [Actinobacteria bacterium]|nr:AMP-binding protein [Actinomycetota bacterium]